MTLPFYEELRARGLIEQVSDEARLVAHLAGGPLTLYCGFDPTADSLHIGSLVPLLTLKRFQQAGHRPILLVGGATGLIGDPSHRADERSLNPDEVVAGWVAKIQAQVRPFLEFEGPAAAVMVNNLDWTRGLDVISFLRDVGKHFSVNMMIQRDSVKSRLAREGAGISFTEFSYMLLQALDYFELAKRYDCTLQIGGRDQWGNIVSGIDLVRRRLSREVHALTLPLITKADGTKFGKTADGAVWLDAAKTSPYSFYQYWLNVADADVLHFLRVFSFLPLDEIDGLASEQAAAPEQRPAQRALARAVTGLVHGEAAVVSAERISSALFAGELEMLTEEDLEQLRQDGMETTLAGPGTVGLLTALADAGLAASRGAARKLVDGRGVSINGRVVEDPALELDWSDARFGRFYLLRRGKKAWHLLCRQH